jgi:hypothetical protein
MDLYSLSFFQTLLKLRRIGLVLLVLISICAGKAGLRHSWIDTRGRKVFGLHENLTDLRKTLNIWDK